MPRKKWCRRCEDTKPVEQFTSLLHKLFRSCQAAVSEDREQRQEARKLSLAAELYKQAVVQGRAQTLALICQKQGRAEANKWWTSFYRAKERCAVLLQEMENTNK